MWDRTGDRLEGTQGSASQLEGQDTSVSLLDPGAATTNTCIVGFQKNPVAIYCHMNKNK